MPDEIKEAIWKFFSPKEEVIQYWYSLVDVQFVTAEFYQMIEKELTDRKVPGLQISRVEFSEGGPLSDKREYLRLKRERLVFDICAAHFGTAFFFSFRFVELPLGIKPLELFVFLMAVGGAFSLFANLLGTILGFIALLVILGGGIYVMGNSVALGLKDLDAKLLQTPVIGPLYEVFLRKETYYREDTRLMYLTTVNDITERLVQEVTSARGVKLLRQYGRKSPGSDLYQVATKRLDGGVDTPSPTA